MAQGQILVYCSDANAGLVRTDEGHTYYFSGSDWDSKAPSPKKGQRVIMDARNNAAHKIRVVNGK